jgi:hypothetical protein
MAFQRQVLNRSDNPFLGWAYGVLEAEGFPDWKIEKGEAYCWQDLKVITFGSFRPTSKSLFLHEVAHAQAPDPETVGLMIVPRTLFRWGWMRFALIRLGGQQFHGGMWADKFTKLCEKHLEGYVDDRV